ncbi:hypothetical protein [Robertkochia aurantiaca]|uniref:hypothetical protein n=1 Tax=Robertkochia aurantiaca TaxID=2873700 RepID=UPI001CCC1D33|nr:hypothetical protein [Robertkochia sp. 3YJGBD-33]
MSTSELELIKDAWGLEKKQMIAEFMDLSDQDSEVFWPLYETYMSDKQKLSAERFGILKDYAENYPDISDEQADDLTIRLFKNNMEIEKLQLKHYKKMRKELSPLLASQFFQGEKYIESVLRTDLQSNIPFIGEFSKMN